MDAVGICNLALSAVGAKRIATLDDASRTAELCKTNLVPVRDAVLGERAWRFALRRHELAEAQEVPAWGPAHRYPLPPSVVQVLEASDGDRTLEDWQREGAAVVTDAAAPIYVRTVDQVDDVSLWPPGFCQAVATRLAAVLAIPITENRSLAADLWQLYGRHLREAIASEGIQGRRGSSLTDYVNRWRV